MRRRIIVAAAGVLAGMVVGAVGALALAAQPPRTFVRAGAAITADVVSACPHFGYAADGTVYPIFCMIDNPAALKYYAKALKPLLALGPNASPGQVQKILAYEYRAGGPNGEVLTGTYPIQCEVFQLAAHRWRWSFFYSPPYCSLPPKG